MEIKIPTELSKLFDLLRKKGCKSFKFNGLEIELTPELPPSNYKKKVAQDVSDDIGDDERFSEADALFWSASQIDETQSGTN